MNGGATSKGRDGGDDDGADDSGGVICMGGACLPVVLVWDRGGGRTTDYLPRRGGPACYCSRYRKILASAWDGVAMNRREFIDVLGGASIAWSPAFTDASGQESRKAYRVGFLTLSQLK